MKLGLIFALTLGVAYADPKVYLEAYPEVVASVEENAVVLKNGQRFVFDDSKEKSHDQKLEGSDLEDQLSQSYPLGPDSYAPPAVDFDPGRIRDEAFFQAIYGETPEAVRKNLITISWMPKSAGRKIQISRINGVDKRLEAVSAELDELPDHLKAFVTDLAGTFNWRPIAGTERLSTHSYGIAIDINTKFSSYWKWDAKYRYRNQIPKEVVEIFEKHGFIWGGKWYHYDTMHFEYRPELLPPAAK